MKFNLIVAIDQNKGIGKDGQLPWHLPEDLKYFKKITTAENVSGRKNIVVMGRKTWESIPEKYRPLPERDNIVLTRDEGYVVSYGVRVFTDFDHMLTTLEKEGLESQTHVFIIGGQQIFENAISHPDCSRLYITHIHKEFSCDAFFPDFHNSFDLTSQKDVISSDGITLSFAVYSRKSS